MATYSGKKAPKAGKKSTGFKPCAKCKMKTKCKTANKCLGAS
jgi:hypothetical protein